MRSRTPTFIWIPFVFSVGTISWALLLTGLVLLSAVIVAPALREAKEAEAVRNNYQATLDVLDQKIAMQRGFIAAATTDPVLMDRLASRQLNLNRSDQDILVLNPSAGAGTAGGAAFTDRSVESLLAESLTEVTPQRVKPVPPLLMMATHAAVRPFLIVIACAAIGLSFFLGVKYERA